MVREIKPNGRLLLTQIGLTSQGAVPPRPIYLYMIHTYEQIFTKRL